MRLLWITNIPSPYRVDFFNELGKSCELTVLFEKAGASDRDDTWLGFQFDYFEGVVMRGAPGGRVLQALAGAGIEGVQAVGARLPKRKRGQGN